MPAPRGPLRAGLGNTQKGAGAFHRFRRDPLQRVADLRRARPISRVDADTERPGLALIQGGQPLPPRRGEKAERGYQGEVDAYRDAKEYEKATVVAREAAKAMPGNKQMQLMLAGQLADTGHAEEGLALANAQLKHNNDDRDVYLALAQIHTRLKRWQDAAADIDKAAGPPTHGA